MPSILKKFSAWHRWADRKDGELNLALPGVYLLAEFGRRPNLGQPKLSKKIFYIGETCGSLRGRLYSFQRSAFENKDGHSGGATYYGARSRELDVDRVFVSVMPVDRPKVEREAFIRYVERAMLWSYYEQFKAMPLCNRK